MAKHISQYCLLGILCIVLVLALAGPTPRSSLCLNNNPSLCDNPSNCFATCHVLLFRKGECVNHICCCLLYMVY
ncbi:hypothetical protein MtrunA17_Chr3g0098051 [Medicago truncatula]|uniref:LCR-like protein n=1 Tax=Medicago truncatula TaxID=3880 RepID=A0A396IR98_MEDTR|nr:hypothetical protein MtrunA17_Chr3g0098051 [Medicago truncatula]